MILDHYLAVKALIPVDLGFDIHFGSVKPRVVNGVKQPIRYPYLVLWGDLGVEGGDSLGNAVDQLDLRPRVTYVGTGFEQCLWVAQKGRDALNRARPLVTGWTPGPLSQNALAPADTDEDVTFPDGSHPVYAVDEFPFTSTRN